MTGLVKKLFQNPIPTILEPGLVIFDEQMHSWIVIIILHKMSKECTMMDKGQTNPLVVDTTTINKVNALAFWLMRDKL